MHLLKNIFFIFAIAFVGILSALMGRVSAHAPQESTLRVVHQEKNLSAILVPDAVIRPENLHYAANLSYKVNGTRYYPQKEIKPFVEKGRASWYGKAFHGRATTSGERYDMHEMTAAHKTLPIPSYVKVRNLDNGREVVVRINDRGPFHGDRIIDLSYAAAEKLGYVKRGIAHVQIEQIIPKAKKTPQKPSTEILAQFDNLPEAQHFMQDIAQQVATSQKQLNLLHEGNHYTVNVGPFTQEKEWTEFRQQLSLR